MAEKSSQKPTYRIPKLRQCNGRGFVELNGKRFYLGLWGSPVTEEAYARAIAEWSANGHRILQGPDEITIGEVIDVYLGHCEEYYRRPDGTPTSHICRIETAVRPLRRLYGRTLARDFGPKAIRTLRETWIEAGLARKTINNYVGVVRHMFRWATSHELIPVTVYQALTTVDNLRRGRSRAKERGPITGVETANIDAIRLHVSRQVWALVQLQLLTGSRGSELLMLRPIDLDTSEKTWTTTLAHHKTAHHGKERMLYFGPKAQAILMDFLQDRPLDAYLFSPRDAEQERHAAAPTHRRPDQKPNRKKTDRALGDHYTSNSYRKAIQRGCEAAGIPPWTPHQLRHTAATRIRKQFGLEAAQIMLGHSHADVTQIYAEVNAEKGQRIAFEIG